MKMAMAPRPQADAAAKAPAINPKSDEKYLAEKKSNTAPGPSAEAAQSKAGKKGTNSQVPGCNGGSGMGVVKDRCSCSSAGSIVVMVVMVVLVIVLVRVTETVVVLEAFESLESFDSFVQIISTEVTVSKLVLVTVVVVPVVSSVSFSSSGGSATESALARSASLAQ